MVLVLIISISLCQVLITYLFYNSSEEMERQGVITYLCSLTCFPLLQSLVQTKEGSNTKEGEIMM